MRLAIALIGAALFIGMGCGVDPVTAPTTYQEYAVAVSQVQCEARFRCCATRCSAGTDQTFNLSLLNTQKLIDAGKLTYNAPSGQTCLDSLRARTQECDTAVNNQPSQSPVCSQVLVGTIAVGQACDALGSNLCVANAYCDGAASPVVCKNYLANGASCTAGGRCQPTSYCETTSSTCKPLPKSGESCMGTSCDNSMTKLVCLPSMLCGAPQDDGAACTTSAQCKSGSCSLAAPRTCTPSTTPPQTVRDALCKG